MMRLLGNPFISCNHLTQTLWARCFQRGGICYSPFKKDLEVRMVGDDTWGSGSCGL
jgi:hypothetical protein